MKERHDEIWQRMVDDESPRHAELHAAERRLRAQRAASLQPRSEPYLARVLVRPARRRRSWRHVVTGGALLLIGLGLPAWVGTRAIFPTDEVAARFPDDYGIALSVAADRDAPLARRREALGLLDGRCGKVARCLIEHARSPDAGVAELAATACRELTHALDTGRPAGTSPTDADYFAALRLHADALASGDVAAARHAVQSLRAVAVPGFAAVGDLGRSGVEPIGGEPPASRLTRLLAKASPRN